MRNIIAFLMIFIWGLSMPSSQSSDGYKAMSEAFYSSGLSFHMAAATGWIKYEAKPQNKKDMKLMADNVYNLLSNNSAVKKQVIDSTENGIVIRGDTEDKIIVLSIINEGKDETGKYYQTMSVEVTQQNEKENIIDIRRRLQSCLEKYGSDPHVYMWISGYVSGNAAQEKRYGIINGILNKLSSKDINKMEDGSIISITGFSPLINDYIICSCNKVNINAACRYSSYDDKTFFILATPLICSEY